MFDMCFIALFDLKNIEIDTKIALIGAHTADLWTITSFLAAILNFTFLAGTVGVTSWFPLFLKSAPSKTP